MTEHPSGEDSKGRGSVLSLCNLQGGGEERNWCKKAAALLRDEGENTEEEGTSTIREEDREFI